MEPCYGGDVRMYQRFPDVYEDNRIRKVLEMEIPCASLWAEERFNPNMFVSVSEDDVKEKIEYIKEYDYVIRRSPHPRSLDNILALSKVRGAMCGVEYAEAFRVVYERE